MLTGVSIDNRRSDYKPDVLIEQTAASAVSADVGKRTCNIADIRKSTARSVTMLHGTRQCFSNDTSLVQMYYLQVSTGMLMKNKCHPKTRR